jgi:CRISPR-associated protein Cas2
MYCILVYDVGEKRVVKALKKCREYLNWIQNSVFEGNLSEAQFEKLTWSLKSIIDQETDSVIIFSMQSDKYLKRKTLGIEKSELTDNFV